MTLVVGYENFFRVGSHMEKPLLLPLRPPKQYETIDKGLPIKVYRYGFIDKKSYRMVLRIKKLQKVTIVTFYRVFVTFL